MAAAGIPIPPAFVIGIDGFNQFRSNGKRIGHELLTEILGSLQHMSELTGRSFAGSDRPLLISVRSGAPISMPGMMDTVLNIGLRSKSAFRLARGMRNSAFRARHLVALLAHVLADIVLGLTPGPHRLDQESESSWRRGRVRRGGLSTGLRRRFSPISRVMAEERAWIHTSNWNRQ